MTAAVPAAAGAIVACIAGRVALARLAVGSRMHTGSGWRCLRAAHVSVIAGVAVTVVVAPALAPVVAVAGAAAPRWWRRLALEREQRAAEAELPEVLESVARALRAGASLGQAVVEAPLPRTASLRRDWMRLRAAVPVDGVSGAVDVVWSPASREAGRALAGAALRLAADVGGPQARALDLAAATLRQRLACGDEVRAQTAQARASTSVITLAPVAFALVAAATDPRYVPFLVRSLPGACLLYAGLALDAAGMAWMARLARGGAR